MKTTNYLSYTVALLTLSAGVIFQQCVPSSSHAGQQGMAAPTLPVIELQPIEAVTHLEFPALLEGKTNVEIRPQVDGYLEKIHVDEGAFVKAGTPLFSIQDRPYREDQASADAGLRAAQANLEKAALEVERLTPLVKHNVVSDVQLKTAQASLETAKANVLQARANAGTAAVNIGFTVIKAPATGYIGRIPYKAGSLVGRGEQQPLTVLSDVTEVYAYFSMSEVDFLTFTARFEGASIEEKLSHTPEVELLLADGSVYPHKGRIETVEGQFDRNTGAISFRATFPNPQRLLRTGNTGRVRIPQVHHASLPVPQQSSYQLQDKTMVFALTDSNTVVSAPIEILAQDDQYYFVDSKTMKPGTRIAYSGIGRLRDGMAIQPELTNADSLLRTHLNQ